MQNCRKSSIHIPDTTTVNS